MAAPVDMRAMLERIHNRVELERLEDERQQNVIRLIAYNNQRCRIGLRPVEMPEKLTTPIEIV